MLLLKTGAKLHNILEKCKYNHEKVVYIIIC